MYTQLYDLVATTALGRLINSENFQAHPQECMKLYEYYLSDFVKSVYITNREKEIKVSTCYTVILLNILLFSCLAGISSN